MVIILNSDSVRVLLRGKGGIKLAQPELSNKKLLKLARKNYDTLVEYCKTLASEGYWEQPEKVLNQPIQDMLDCYVQAVLVGLAVYCGRFHEDEKKFIMELPKQNILGCTLEEETEERVMAEAKKIMKAPPILLQLCGVRDVEKDSDMTEHFFDSFLNILLSMAYMNHAKDTFAKGFIQAYFEEISIFIRHGGQTSKIGQRYMFKKLSSESFFEDFEYFAERVVQEVRKEPEEIKYRKGTYYNFSDEEEWDEEEENYDYYGEYEDGEIKEELFNSEKEDNIIKEEDINSKKHNDTEQIENETENNSLEKGLKDNLENTKETDTIIEENEVSKLDSYLEELNNLVGLKEVKEEINSLINLIKVKKLRESYHMPTMDMTYHMVFTGNPGTGKTTVARLVAKIYRELGILSNGNLIETDRSGLIAGYVGQTAIKVKEVVEKAIGGVLFIDEAYSLTNGNITNDFGSEAIDTIVKLMEDYRDDLVIIVAGYKEEMKQFLESNTGLLSRFNKFIEFPDYTNEELMDILQSMAEQSGVTLAEEAKEYMKEEIASMSQEEFDRFGNARGVRNVFEKIMVNQANRIVLIENPTIEQLQQITKEDARQTVRV